MGSFNVTCGITHVSINPGDEAVIAVLFPHKTAGAFDNPPCGVFPVVIKGIYDDYGRLRDVVRTPGVTLIEKAFELDIDKFLGVLTDSRSGEDLYSEWADLMRPEIMADLSNYSSSLDSAWMELVGFKKMEPADYPIQELQLEESWWTHDELPDVIVRLRPYFYQGARQKDQHWAAYIKTDRQWSPDGLADLVIGFHNHDNKVSLLDCIYRGTGIHLAYPPDRRNKPLFHRIRQMSYVWLHGQFFDVFSKPQFGESGKRKLFWWQTSDSDVDSETLELLGFVKDDAASNIRQNTTVDDPKPSFSKHRYYMVYRHSSSSKWVVFSDGRWSFVSTEDDNSYHGKRVGSTYSVEDLIKVWKRKTKFQLVVPEEIATKTRYAKCFQDLRASLAGFESSSTLDRPRIRRYLDPLSKNGGNYNPIMCFQHKWGAWDFVREIFLDGILDGSLEDEMASMAQLISNLYSIAHPLLPMPYYGPQCGNPYMSKVFGEVISDIANAEIKERKSYAI